MHFFDLVDVAITLIANMARKDSSDESHQDKGTALSY